MTVANKETAAFVLDDRTIGTRLDMFRAYSRSLPYDKFDGGGPWPPMVTNWAQVLLGFEAGAWDPQSQDHTRIQSAADLSWPYVRERLVAWYDAPERADGSMPPERAFLLTLLGLLETPQALLNQLPARYRDLYYRQMLAVSPRSAQADRVTVRFVLVDGVREQVLPAGLQLDAGQDSAGTPLLYALDQPLAANAARLTDLRWVVRDPCVPGGRRARVVLDEAAGQPWPAPGVRLFEASPAKAGEAPRSDADRAVASGRIVGSPVLAAAGGDRQWIVTFDSEPVGPLRMALSVADAWVALDCTKNDGTTWTIKLAADGPVPSAVTALDGLSSATPLLRVTDETGEPVPAITKLELTVAGAVGVHCATDDGTTLSGGGLPFGETAQTGSGLSLISAEWWRLGPKLQQVTVTPTWAGLPPVSFPQWYGPDKQQSDKNWLKLDQDLNVDLKNGKALDELTEWPANTLAHRVTNQSVQDVSALISADQGYPGKPTNNNAFTVQATLVQQTGKPQPLGGVQALFNDDAERVPVGKLLSVPLSSVPAAAIDAPTPDDDDPAKWPWRVRVALSQSFLQAAYVAHQQAPSQAVTLLTEQTSKQLVPDTITTKDQCKVYKMVDSGQKGLDGKEIFLPAMKEEILTIVTPVPVTLPKAQWQTPYVPQWTGLQVDYKACDTQVSQQVITPFGYAAQDDAATQAPAEAELYLGLDGIEAEQLLSMHWQLISPAAMPLEWQYLTPGERWTRLPVIDQTQGWHTSGGWSVDWPGDASRTATSLPAGRMWLRGRVRQLGLRDADQMALATTPWLTGLATNTVTATLVAPETVQSDHFEGGLPALRVTQALGAPETVQQVEQPWPSSGGRAADTRAVFEARVARRLRHRERGLNNIDLTTLLHEQYPGLRELTVLPPERDEKGALKQTIVVMPGPSLSDSADVRRPGLSASHLADLVTWLKARTSPWLTLACVNPAYVPMNVSWDAGYTVGVSRAIGYAKAEAALDAALVPWADASDDGTVQAIGQAVTHERVRTVLRTVAEVANVNAVYLNGVSDAHATGGVPGMSIAPNQVPVVTCTPLEYTGVSVAWLCPQAGTRGLMFGQLTMVGDGRERATVQVTLPKQVVGLGAAPIDTADADVYLIDLETGQRLPGDAPSGAGLWAKPSQAPVQWDSACYAEPRGAAPSIDQSDMRIQYFDVGASAGTSGVHRLGVAVGLKVDKVPDVTLQSAVVDACVTVNVRLASTAALWLDKARWRVTLESQQSVSAPDKWSATLEKYVYGMKDTQWLESVLKFAVPGAMRAGVLKDKTACEVKDAGLHPIAGIATPHGVVGGADKCQDEVVLWYVDPQPNQVYGVDVGSSIGQAKLGSAVSFTPDVRVPRQLAVYALRLKTDQDAKADKTKIGKAVGIVSATCAVTIVDASAWGAQVGQLQTELGMVPTLQFQPVTWKCEKGAPISITGSLPGSVTCAVTRYLLRSDPASDPLPALSRKDKDPVTRDAAKRATAEGTSGSGLVVLGSDTLTSLRGHNDTIHLWWADPDPDLKLGFARDSAIGTIKFTNDITFTVPARVSGKWALYDMQIKTERSPTSTDSDRIGVKCDDMVTQFGASVAVSQNPSGALTLMLDTLSYGAPEILKVES
ncbi:MULTISPECIES: hypothetical protein [unclassified Burkholderia]|uniref:hypothetical protein n=1 Tax=unclassified Burkholderia TaxID=2613784 RepID=UPI0007521DD3|nr:MULTISPECIES: hypothetical protein [unclassified Burkholderia]KVN20660.1 hypothetical protein WT08_28135 [Burkholderia sp. MSMB1552]KWZ46944.1 hypothetical protein WS92_29835 [Burkholderia sp. MSMB1588]